MNVTYVSAALDTSGYAEAARNYIAALDHAGVTVNVVPISFENFKPELGPLGDKVRSLINKNDPGKINILHVTPDNYPRLLDVNKYNIGYAAWESSRLPEHWVPYLNRLNEVWVPCQHNVEVFKSSGVKVPVFCFPHTFRKDLVFDEVSEDDMLPQKNSDDFVFYSIFQWTERKNPMGLLVAYLTEFKPEEKVALVVKSYFLNPNNGKESIQMRETIGMIKKKLYLKEYPKIFLISSLLSRGQILKLHEQADCYVSLHRCEGFGIPITEAMMAGNPVVATTYGGPADFGFPETGYGVDYSLTPCFGMPWPLYTGKMEWAEPDILQARRHMRAVFEDQKRAKQVGATAQHWVESELSWEKIGNKMKERLEEIERNL